MSSFITFLILLVVLFILSGALAKHLGSLVHRITKSSKLTVWILAIIFLPGTVIHEFAHAAVAAGLGVYVGDIKLFPEIDKGGIKLGSVQVGDVDPFRNFLIGIAPLLVGLALILTAIAISTQIDNGQTIYQVLLFYLLFQIGNTMFSSKKDLEGALELLIATITLIAVAYVLDFKVIFDLIISATEKLNEIYKSAANSLLKIIIMDVFIILVSKILNNSFKSVSLKVTNI